MNPIAKARKVDRSQEDALSGRRRPRIQPHQLERMVSSWPSPEAREWTLKFIKDSCGEESIDSIVVIGSLIRATLHEKSDVDLVVIYHGDKVRIKHAPIDVDVRQFDRDSVDCLIAEGNDLLGWAAKFGLAVCDPDQFWERLVPRWSERLPLPSPETAINRAHAAQQRAQELLGHGDRSAASELVVSMLTQRARAALSGAGIYPASRGELPGQLIGIGELDLAEELRSA